MACGSAENSSWWRHQMVTFSALLALCVGNSPVTEEVPSQRPVARSFDVFFHQCLNKWLSKQSWGWWFETPSRSLWRHYNVFFCEHTQSGIVWMRRHPDSSLLLQQLINKYPEPLDTGSGHMFINCGNSKCISTNSNIYIYIYNHSIMELRRWMFDVLSQ